MHYTRQLLAHRFRLMQMHEPAPCTESCTDEPYKQICAAPFKGGVLEIRALTRSKGRRGQLYSALRQTTFPSAIVQEFVARPYIFFQRMTVRQRSTGLQGTDASLSAPHTRPHAYARTLASYDIRTDTRTHIPSTCAETRKRSSRTELHV
jgi:hypothetical protein